MGSQWQAHSRWHRRGCVSNLEHGYRQTSDAGQLDQTIHSVAWSPDGKYICSGSNDGSVCVWDLETERPRKLVGHEGQVYGIAWAGNAAMIASAGSDQTIKLWTPQGGLIQTLRGHKSNITDLAFSTDSRYLASISWDNTVRIWNTADFTGLTTLPATSARRFHSGIAFRPGSGLTLACVTGGGSVIEVWNAQGETYESRRVPFAVQRGSEVADKAFAKVDDAEHLIATALTYVDGLARSGYIQVFLVQRNSLVLAGAAIDPDKHGYESASLEGVIGQAYRRRASIWISDVQKSDYYIAAEPSTRSEYSVPLLEGREGRVLGVMNLEFTVDNALTSEERRWIEEFVSVLSSRLGAKQRSTGSEGRHKIPTEMVVPIDSDELIDTIPSEEELTRPLSFASPSIPREIIAPFALREQGPLSNLRTYLRETLLRRPAEPSIEIRNFPGESVLFKRINRRLTKRRPPRLPQVPIALEDPLTTVKLEALLPLSLEIDAIPSEEDFIV